MAITLNILTGCTASGKGRVGLELAQRYGGEIISIDSMKIYRRMDIGTAKPSQESLKLVLHHMIDVVEPYESYSLARYLEQAEAIIKDIASRGKPILAVGGTMLYVQGLIAGVFEGPASDPELRKEIRQRAQKEGIKALYDELAKLDPKAAERIHPNDLRRIERALEVFHLTGKPISELQTQWEKPVSPYNCRLVALRWEKEQASRRINARVKRMIECGLVDEVQQLLAESRGIGKQAAQAVGYAEIIAHLRGEMSLEDAIEKIKINTRRLAKNQRTWMQRIPGIQWVDVGENDSVEQIVDRVGQCWAL